jgi:hypothetical protein
VLFSVPGIFWVKTHVLLDFTSAPSSGAVVELRFPRLWHGVFRHFRAHARLLNQVEFLPLVIFGMPSFVRLSWNLLCKRAASLPCIV